MSIVDEVVNSTKIFDRGKTTVPAEIRRLLEIKDGDRILWIMDSSNRVYVESAMRRGIRYPKPIR